MGVLRFMGGSSRWRPLFIFALLAVGASTPNLPQPTIGVSTPSVAPPVSRPSVAISAPQATAHSSLLASCQPRTDNADSFAYRFCSAYVASFDGVPLDVDLTLPAGETPKGGYPLIVMMHGWGEDKSSFEASDFCTSTPASNCMFNNVWFASRGYAVLNYTARGFHGSCGPGSPNASSPSCARGWTHLSDMRWEIHDTQYLSGLLVDSGTVRPAIGVTGLSYGAGQSWLLAVMANRVMNPDGTVVAWTSPRRGIPMRIGAAGPRYGWTDLADALQPNGRASDGVVSANGDRTNPLGIEKKSYVDFLYSDGLSTARYAPPGADPTADLTTWYNEISAGETPAQSQYAPGIVTQITQFRSAYYQGAFIAGDVPSRETPIFAVQGWTDALFPQSQGASMVAKLRAADAAWPAYLYVSDLGHPPANNGKSSEWRVINPALTSFFDLHLRGAGSNPSAIYKEQLVTCDSSAGTVYASNTLSGISPGRAIFQSSGSGHVTASPAADAAGAQVDPIGFYVANGGHGGCVKVAVSPPDTAASTSWSFPVCSTFNLLGEPGVHLDASAVGTDAEVNTRLWDVAPDGSAILVTRGMFRWNGNPGSTSINYALEGSGWTFAAGHQLRLQVTQNDGPYMRPDNYPSSFVYSALKLTLPTTAAPAC